MSSIEFDTTEFKSLSKVNGDICVSDFRIFKTTTHLTEEEKREACGSVQGHGCFLISCCCSVDFREDKTLMKKQTLTTKSLWWYESVLRRCIKIKVRLFGTSQSGFCVVHHGLHLTVYTCLSQPYIFSFVVLFFCIFSMLQVTGCCKINIIPQLSFGIQDFSCILIQTFHYQPSRTSQHVQVLAEHCPVCRPQLTMKSLG